MWQCRFVRRSVCSVLIFIKVLLQCLINFLEVYRTLVNYMWSCLSVCPMVRLSIHKEFQEALIYENNSLLQVYRIYILGYSTSDNAGLVCPSVHNKFQ